MRPRTRTLPGPSPCSRVPNASGKRYDRNNTLPRVRCRHAPPLPHPFSPLLTSGASPYSRMHMERASLIASCATASGEQRVQMRPMWLGLGGSCSAMCWPGGRNKAPGGKGWLRLEGASCGLKGGGARRLGGRTQSEPPGPRTACLILGCRSIPFSPARKYRSISTHARPSFSPHLPPAHRAPYHPVATRVCPYHRVMYHLFLSPAPSPCHPPKPNPTLLPSPAPAPSPPYR